MHSETSVTINLIRAVQCAVLILTLDIIHYGWAMDNDMGWVVGWVVLNRYANYKYFL